MPVEDKNNPRDLYPLLSPPPTPELPDELEIEQPVEEVIVEETPTREANGDDLDDLFKVPSREDPDMRIDDVVSVSEEDVFGEGGEDMSDLLEVSDEDIMGEDWGEPTPAPQPTQPKHVVIRKVRRTSKPYIPPPASVRRLNV